MAVRIWISVSRTQRQGTPFVWIGHPQIHFLSLCKCRRKEVRKVLRSLAAPVKPLSPEHHGQAGKRSLSPPHHVTPKLSEKNALKLASVIRTWSLAAPVTSHVLALPAKNGERLQQHLLHVSITPSGFCTLPTILDCEKHSGGGGGSRKRVEYV